MATKHLSINKGNVKSPKIEIDNFDHPIFCLKFLHKDFHLHKCNKDEKSALIDQMERLSQMTWQNIQYTSRKGLGTEQIDRDAIKATFPSIVTEDVKDLLAFRFLGNAPFVGIRNRFIFHVLYIDSKFTLYNHGEK